MILKNYVIFGQTYAAFTLGGFDDQERNLMVVKTDFQVSKLKFYACNFKHAFYPLHKLLYRVTLTTQTYCYISFCSVPGCQTCMCKRALISH